MARKKLILIGGTMGIGKTTIGQYLVAKRLDHAVFLDGDWCWAMHPWVFNEENKAMVLRNIQFLLNSFIANSSFDNIVFVWVMHQQAIIDDLVAGLHGDYDLYSFSLTATEAELTKRFSRDVDAGIRDQTALQGAIDRLKMYQAVKSIKVDVSGRDYPETADIMINEIQKGADR
ncbi:AAA family ATPase [Lacticaseibacillus absianus]|uniref:AAA family ATPase n=1 Tax=Lacticaseibacillus absianus TaxID=2729623 RepID=UPI0015C78890|nr:AAA family ATPase [Lacticaseibacillus absianus]